MGKDKATYRARRVLSLTVYQEGEHDTFACVLESPQDPEHVAIAEGFDSVSALLRHLAQDAAERERQEEGEEAGEEHGPPDGGPVEGLRHVADPGAGGFISRWSGRRLPLPEPGKSPTRRL